MRGKIEYITATMFYAIAAILVVSVMLNIIYDKNAQIMCMCSGVILSIGGLILMLVPVYRSREPKSLSGKCDHCHRMCEELEDSYVHQMIFFPKPIEVIVRALPFSISWWLQTRKIPNRLCEECYISGHSGVHPVKCDHCGSVIFLRYTDFTWFNEKRQGFSKEEACTDGFTMSLDEEGLKCPYCQFPLTDLNYTLAFARGFPTSNALMGIPVFRRLSRTSR